MNAELATWALPRLSRLLPIDDESLKELIIYTASLSRESGAEHLKNLLGDSAQALEFISTFNSRRPDITPTPALVAISQNPQPVGSLDGTDAVQSPRKRGPRKVKAPLHSAGPARQPENYGDVTGGYYKSSKGDEYMPGRPSASLPNAFSLSQEPAALQLPTTNQKVRTASAPSSREASPSRLKLPPSASGSLTSDLPNVKAKQSKKPAHSSSSTPHKTTTTASINDLTAAIAALELSTNPSLSSEQRKCPCNASIHPLFSTAPNCLSCGKIICALEGLQPCSFCGSPILTMDQVQSMIRTLKDERGQERMAAHNASVSQSGRGTPLPGGTTPESSGDEASGAAARARAHKDRLLAFQRENAQRTKVHDEAADYDVAMTPGATQWMSAVQRATALKKQQQYLREMEEQDRPEWEKTRTVMSMSVKNGKVLKTYGTVRAPAPTASRSEDDGEIADGMVEEPDPQVSGKGALSNNPLLADRRLVRPMYKRPEDEKGKGKERAPRENKWRRVQDDHDDNEQWILDGGIHGHEDRSDHHWQST